MPPMSRNKSREVISSPATKPAAATSTDHETRALIKSCDWKEVVEYCKIKSVGSKTAVILMCRQGTTLTLTEKFEAIKRQREKQQLSLKHFFGGMSP